MLECLSGARDAIAAATSPGPAPAATGSPSPRAASIGSICRTPRVVKSKVGLRGYPGSLRALAVPDLGLEKPTLLLTKQAAETPTHLVDRYARRMVVGTRSPITLTCLTWTRPPRLSRCGSPSTCN